MDGLSEEQRLQSAKTLTAVLYALYAASCLFGVTAVVAIIVNYVKRDDVAGTYLESHFRWQIRTFWFALLWIVIAVFLVMSLIGIPFALALVAGAGLWVIYRVVRGWWNLLDRSGMPMPPPPL